jgi:hypothetical protein
MSQCQQLLFCLTCRYFISCILDPKLCGIHVIPTLQFCVSRMLLLLTARNYNDGGVSSSGVVFVSGCMKGDRLVQKGKSGTETAW